MYGDPTRSYEHAKRMQCLNFVATVLHTSNPACNFLLPTMLTDVIDTYGHSTELVRTLA